ncbi:MAG: SAM-dependent methyltransferase [Frankiales bacterium]|nr:SAM-dependent methyltransferase [Frankiales bacterium]
MDRATDLDVGSIAAAEAMRPFGEAGRLALEQVRLRRRALVKHPDGDRLWWTAEALEQSTPRTVALHHSRRYGEATRVLDLGCSVGGDLLCFGDRGLGVDLDEARCLLARVNTGAPVACADVTRLDPRGWVFADPARRVAGRRGFDPSSWSPSLAQALAWDVDALGVKVAPGIDHDALPPELEVEITSLDGDVKEAMLWGGATTRGHRMTATLLPSGAQLHGAGAVAAAGPVGRYLLEPDGAVIRAHLVAEVCIAVDGRLVDPTIAYVTADALTTTPFGRWYEVLDVMPFSLKRLREALRGVGTVAIKKRGTAVEPETLRKQLKLSGSGSATVVLTRVAGAQKALLVQPL